MDQFHVALLPIGWGGKAPMSHHWQPMGDLRLVSCSDQIALGRETNRFLAEALAAHPGRFVALAVGDSTLPLYAHLDELGPSWAGRSIMPVDELVPPPADTGSRFSARLAAALPETLRSRLVPIQVDEDPELAAIALEARLRAEGLAAVVLGLGPDGHVAFNQPPTPVDARTRVVPLAPRQPVPAGGCRTVEVGADDRCHHRSRRRVRSRHRLGSRQDGGARSAPERAGGPGLAGQLAAPSSPPERGDRAANVRRGIKRRVRPASSRSASCGW